MIKNASSVTVVLALVAAVGMSACTVTPPRLEVRAPTVAIWAPVAPPAARVEYMPPAPSHDHVWIPGYWHWENNQHRWMEGHWEQRREHEHWVAHQWDRDDRGQWRLNGGYWRHD